jgi:hypothetical protein
MARQEKLTLFWLSIEIPSFDHVVTVYGSDYKVSCTCSDII